MSAHRIPILGFKHHNPNGRMARLAHKIFKPKVFFRLLSCNDVIKSKPDGVERDIINNEKTILCGCDPHAFYVLI